MAELNNNSYSGLLSLLMDGQLDKASEDSLYKTIAGDTGLQEELGELINIRESVKRDREAYNPPSELTNSVFSTLGYTSPYGQTAAGTAAKAGFWQSMTAKRIIPVFGLVVAGLFTWFMTDSSETITAKQNIPVVSSFAASAESETTDASVSSSSGSSLFASAAERSSSASQNSAFAANFDDEDESKKASSPEVAKSNERVTASLADAPEDRSTVQSSQRHNIATVRFCNAETFNSGLFTSNNFNADVKQFMDGPSNNSTWFITVNGLFSGLNNGMPGTGSFALANSSIGAHTKVSSNLSIGGKVGVETFSRFETNNLDQRVMNEVSALWFVLPVRYDFNFAEIMDIKPYAEFAPGIVQNGNYLLKGGIGLAYQPENSWFGINAGYEYSHLNYFLQQETLTSNKSGFTAGICIKF